jgi:hypothetical protein
MRNRLCVLCLLAFVLACAAPSTAANSYRGRQQRAETFEFGAKPTIEKKGDGFVIRFATKAACDATVMILDKDGRIVRHLASGVLGKNAPAPFKQGTLEQELAWDGKDDFGKAVDRSTCQVKVGLGLTARYDRSLGWSPGQSLTRVAIATDRDGRLYVLDGSFAEWAGATTFSVRVFDRDGKYLRQIAPPPSTSAGKAATMGWNQTAWGATVPRANPGYHGVSLTSDYVLGNRVVRQTPVVTPDGRFVFLTPTDYKRRDRWLVMVDGRDGTVASGDRMLIDKGAKLFGRGGPVHMALSPDGKWLYFGSQEERGSAHCVFRTPLAKPGTPTVFAGRKRKAGKDDVHFNTPIGVACDAAGNVYVADSMNNRIQVLKPDGTYLGTLPVKRPILLAVHEKSGAVYVLSFFARRKMKLLRLGGLADPATKIEGPEIGCMYSDGGSRMARSPLLALDQSGDTPRVWVKHFGSRLVLLEDRGTAFKELPNGDVNRVEKGWRGWGPWEHQAQIAADPVREELYIREGGMSFSDSMIRVDGRTGRVLDRFGRRNSGGSTPLGIEQARVSWEGRVYLRTGHNGIWLTEYNPRTKQPDPLPGSVPTGNAKGSQVFKGKPYKGIHIPANGSVRSFQDVMGIALNGDLYIPCGIRAEDIPLLKKAGLDYPTRKELYRNPFRGSLLKVYSPDGTLKCLSALPGLGPSQGVCVGRDGAVYMALECQPLGVKRPEGMAKNANVSGASWATVVKFNSRHDTYPIGRINGRWTKDLGGKPTHRWLRGGFKKEKDGAGPVRIENVAWDYPGFGLFKGNSCNCPKSNMSMDGFERLFVPALHTCTVNVLDANGNIVVRIGGYGNADSRGKDSPVIDPETGELRPRRKDDPQDLESPLATPEIGLAHPNFTAVTDEALYVNDRANYRIVRAVLKYQAEVVLELPCAPSSRTPEIR